MRIGIDCRLAGVEHAGIGRYIENLVTRLITTHTNYTWVLFFIDEAHAHRVLGKQTLHSNVEIRTTQVRHYTFAEQLVLPWFYHSAKLDLLHVPHFNVPMLYLGNYIVTIHDLLWHQQRGPAVTTLDPWLYWLKYFCYRVVVTLAIWRAQGLLVPTETVKRSVAVLYPNAAKKTHVTKEGARQLLTSGKPPQTRLDNKTLLFVGSLYPHKNVNFVIQALHKLPKYRLLLVGSRSVFQKETEKFVRSQQLQQRVEFLGFLPDEKLAGVYTQATALVQPSLSEGFGLTGVEALSLGTPVLASDIPVFREIYQDSALFFDPKSTDSFVHAVRTLEQPPIRKKLAAAGKKVTALYDWDRMTAETVRVYSQLLS